MLNVQVLGFADPLQPFDRDDALDVVLSVSAMWNHANGFGFQELMLEDVHADTGDGDASREWIDFVGLKYLEYFKVTIKHLSSIPSTLSPGR